MTQEEKSRVTIESMKIEERRKVDVDKACFIMCIFLCGEETHEVAIKR